MCRWWDWLTGFAIVFTAIVTPFEVGYLPPSHVDDPLFIINRFMGALPQCARAGPSALGSACWSTASS